MYRSFFNFCLFFLIVCFIPQHASAQVRDSVAYYLDDNRISNTQNIIKVNLAALLPGDLSLGYERKIGKLFAVEGGAGLLLPFYVPEALGLFTMQEEIIDPKGGYSFFVQPKMYLRKAFEYSYIAVQYRKRHYMLHSGAAVEYNDYSFNSGYQFYAGKRIRLDFNLGIGIRFKRIENAYNVYYNGYSPAGIVMPLALKIGYAF